MKQKIIKSISKEAKTILVRGQNTGWDGLDCCEDCKVRDLISTWREYTASLPCWIDHNTYTAWYYNQHWSSSS